LRVPAIVIGPPESDDWPSAYSGVGSVRLFPRETSLSVSSGPPISRFNNPSEGAAPTQNEVPSRRNARQGLGVSYFFASGE